MKAKKLDLLLLVIYLVSVLLSIAVCGIASYCGWHVLNKYW